MESPRQGKVNRSARGEGSDGEDGGLPTEPREAERALVSIVDVERIRLTQLLFFRMSQSAGAGVRYVHTGNSSVQVAKIFDDCLVS